MGVTLRSLLSQGEAGCDIEEITVTKVKRCNTEVITVTKVKLGVTLRRLLSPN